MPLMPPGVSGDGDEQWATSIGGTSAAVGSR